MEREIAGPIQESIRSLGRDLPRETIRKWFPHSEAGALLFSLAAVAVCRIAFDSPGEKTFLYGLGKAGIFMLYLLGGFVAGSLHGTASAGPTRSGTRSPHSSTTNSWGRSPGTTRRKACTPFDCT